MFFFAAVTLGCNTGSDPVNTPPEAPPLTPVTAAPPAFTPPTVVGEARWYQYPDGRRKVTNVFGFHTKTAIGDKATLVPATTGFAPQEASVTAVSEGDVGEDAPSVNVELSDIADPAWQAAAITGPPDGGGVAFRLIVLHPPVPSARALEISSVPADALPKGVSASLVVGAVDFTGDERPEVVSTEFCCDNPVLPAAGGTCEYTCGADYLRTDAEWAVVRSTQPL